MALSRSRPMVCLIEEHQIFRMGRNFVPDPELTLEAVKWGLVEAFMVCIGRRVRRLWHVMKT